MKLLLHYRASPGFRQALAEVASAEVATAVVDEDDDAALGRELADTDVLLHVLKPVTAAMIEAAPRLRLIQKLGVGVNTIDLDAARTRRIAVANMPGVNSQAVAEMTLALMLSVLRRLSYLDPLTRDGQGWRPDPAMLDASGEIAGRTVGFVGFGAGPIRLAPVLTALGATVVYTARAPKPDRPERFLPLPALLAQADIVTLHAPLTPETRGLIDARALAAMKPDAVLINTARGELLDEPALVAALRSGRLRGAGLDVFAAEPVAPDSPLLSLPNVTLTPHLAWLTPESLRRGLAVTVENCRRLQNGAPLLNQVA